jgi:hypothetical protein
MFSTISIANGDQPRFTGAAWGRSQWLLVFTLRIELPAFSTCPVSQLRRNNP